MFGFFARKHRDFDTVPSKLLGTIEDVNAHGLLKITAEDKIVSIISLLFEKAHLEVHFSILRELRELDIGYLCFMGGREFASLSGPIRQTFLFICFAALHDIAIC